MQRVEQLKGVPTGSMLLWGGAIPGVPAGYLLCFGQAVSRTDYAALFSAIGTTFGIGDGATTFNVPNWIDRIPYGAVAALGTTVTGTAMAGSHAHTVTAKNAGDPRLQTTNDGASFGWATSTVGSATGYKIAFIIKT